MADPDPVMRRLGEGLALAQSGEREAGRRVFAEVWEEIGGERGDPFHRCALTHWMADVQDDPEDELLWDRRALEAADLIRDECAAAAGVSSPVAGFYPSLHLNLAECYRKLGRYDQARRHLAAGQAAVDALPVACGLRRGRRAAAGVRRMASRHVADEE